MAVGWVFAVGGPRCNSFLRKVKQNRDKAGKIQIKGKMASSELRGAVCKNINYVPG